MPAGGVMFRKGISRTFCFYWMPFFCYVALIFYLSHQSDPAGDLDLPISDKILHFFEYFLLIFFTLRAFRRSASERVRKNFILYSILFSLLYALSDELHQWYIPDRECSLLDFIADGVGIGVGTVIFRNRTI